MHMSYQMWKKGRHNDYKFIDGAIAEQYNMGGVDMWLYTYLGPAVPTSDGSKEQSNINISSIGNLVFGETASRNYSLQAITLPAVYQIQEATPDLKLTGLFFNWDTMDITIHYNTMMQRVGRKIMPGDVLELPNLRDFDVLDKDSGFNRFYVVQDSFRTSEGYSVTWQHHIFKLRVKPLTNSPEFGGILGDNDYPSNPDDPNDGNGNGSGNINSTEQNELDIMNRIIAQADDEVPYIHWDNEHIYDDISGIDELTRHMLSGYEFPVNPTEHMFFMKLTYPVLYERTDNTWTIVQASYGDVLPAKADDGEFFFMKDEAAISGYNLYQYYVLSVSRWVPCSLPYTDINTIPSDAEDFYVFYQDPQMYQVLADKSTWIIPEPSSSDVPFTSKGIAANRTNPQDIRSAIPPARGTVGEGSTFPSSPADKEQFYRTDLTPVTLWTYDAKTSSWTQFSYGGRLPWVGPDQEQARFVNGDNRVALSDVVKPNLAYRIKKDK